MTQWVATVEKDVDTGELVLQFPDGCLEHLGWAEGDVLEWQETGNGAYSLTKKE